MNKQNNKKKTWSKKAYSSYFKESRELSDYSCSKKGIIQSKFKKKT